MPKYPGTNVEVVTKGMTDWDDELNAVLSAPVTPQMVEAIAGSRVTALRNFHNALASRSVDILAVGDSKTEGHGASVVTKRWLNLVMDDLRKLYNPTGVLGGLGYIPGWYHSTYGAAPMARWVTSGSTTQIQGTGLGRRAIQLNSSGASMSITATCTSFTLFATKQNAAANSVTVSINGGSTISPTWGTLQANPTVGGAVWSSGQLTAGSHTIVVTWASAVPQIEGAFLHGDETSGVRVWDAAHFGCTAAGLSTGTPIPWMGAVPAVKPALTLIAMGTNDYGNGITSASYKASVQTMISQLRAQYPKQSVVLITQEQRPSTAQTVEPYANYAAANYEIAAADPTVTVLDLSQRMLAGDVDTDGLHTDTVHFSDKGNRLVADYVLNFLKIA